MFMCHKFEIMVMFSLQGSSYNSVYPIYHIIPMSLITRDMIGSRTECKFSYTSIVKNYLSKSIFLNILLV